MGNLRVITVGERFATGGLLTVNVGGSSEELPMEDRSCRAGDLRVRDGEDRARLSEAAGKSGQTLTVTAGLPR